MKTNPRPLAAFTMVEMVVAAGVIAVLGGVVFALTNASLTLYGQNVSINRTLSDGGSATEKLLVKVTAATAVPDLVDEAGATVTGNGPAAGIRFFSPASSRAYPVPAAVSATATSFTITKTAGQPVPVVGDRFSMNDVGFRGVISTVSGSGSTYTIGFASSVGSGFSPARTAGTVIPAASKGFLSTPMAFISVNGTLRHYPRAMSVAQHGAAVFNTSGNFDAVATLLPVGTLTNCTPFQYPTAARRAIDVKLRVRAPAHGGRIGKFYTFQNLSTTVAYRSAL